MIEDGSLFGVNGVLCRMKKLLYILQSGLGLLALFWFYRALDSLWQKDLTFSYVCIMVDGLIFTVIASVEYVYPIFRSRRI